ISGFTSTNKLSPEPQVKPTDLFSLLEDNFVTPLVISKSSLEPNLVLEETPSVSQESENLSSISSNIDMSAFTNVDNLSQPNDLTPVFSIEPNLEPQAKPYEFDFNINNSTFDIEELSKTPIVAQSMEETSQTLEEIFSEMNVEANVAQESNLLPSVTSLPIEETPETVPSFSLSSIPLEQVDPNSLMSVQENLHNQSRPTQVTEEGKFEFDLDLPKPPVKTTVDIEKALASFEAEKDRLANAPTLSELPIIEDVPDPDPDILDLDLSSEALKETQKIPIIKRPTDYLQKSYDNQFDPIPPNYPTVKVPVVPYLEDEQDAIESAKEQLKKFATVSEINKITTKLPAVVVSLPEGLEVKTTNIEPQVEPQVEPQPQKPVKPPLTEQEIDTDDIYLDPFTGVFEAVTFPDEEESKIPASLLVNKFANKTSLPEPIETAFEVVTEIPPETTTVEVTLETTLEVAKLPFDVENTIIERQTKELVSNTLNIGEAANSPEYPTESMSLNNIASTVTESEIMTTEIINQLANIEKTAKLQDSTYTQSEEFQEFTNVENEKFDTTALLPTEALITNVPATFGTNKLIDVS
ncbi:MAG: hypothetical protein FD167_5341, partial [bacterium]